MQFSLNDVIISSGWSSYSKNVLFIYCLGTVFNFPFLVELVVVERVAKNAGVFFFVVGLPQSVRHGPKEEFDTDRS